MFSNDFESKLRGIFSQARNKIPNTCVDSDGNADSVPTAWVEDGNSNSDVPMNAMESSECATENCCDENCDHEEGSASLYKNHPVYRELKSIGRSRRIVRLWPRDPNGAAIMKESPPGKTAGNGQLLWGATVLDFYMVSRLPRVLPPSMFSTGSKLAAFVKQTGETEYAKDEIKCADDEPDPYQIFPCSMDELIKTMDTRRTLGIPNLFIPKLPSGILPSTSHPKLESRIPLHLLPQRLVVHDPHGVLRVGRDAGLPIKPDRVYKLKLTREALLAAEQERNKLSKEHKSRTKEGRLYLTPSEDLLSGKITSGPVIEPVLALHPEAPPPLLDIPEAHLYIDKDELLGTGHHSHVFKATWEIPRRLFQEPYICHLCFENAFYKVLRKEAPDVVFKEDDKMSDKIETLLITIASRHGRTGTMSIIGVKKPGKCYNVEDINGDVQAHVPHTKASTTVTEKYEGSRREINVPGVKWTIPGDGQRCKHDSEERDFGPMFKAHVAAKLSMKGDPHLANEAKNYQSFPSHFFEHWSGYNLVPPNHDPTPALAIVPQFYGYYVPEEDTESNEGKGSASSSDTPAKSRSAKKEYLSPIMLMEDCGEPIDVDKLSLDDRHECAALLFRMHAANWLHGSFYPRNVVISHGDISKWPIQRKMDEHRFRIIDFGRSTKVAPADLFLTESLECQKMLNVLNGPMSRLACDIVKSVREQKQDHAFYDMR